jgi:hypothetical protein
MSIRCRLTVDEALPQRADSFEQRRRVFKQGIPQTRQPASPAMRFNELDRKLSLERMDLSPDRRLRQGQRGCCRL